jgi:hypothetical protein
VFQEEAEFVSAEARDRVAAAQTTSQQAGDPPEEVIPGLVTATIVHDFESVQVHVAHSVLRRTGRSLGQHPRQASLERLPGDQTREGIVRRFVRECADRAPPFSDIVKDQHHTGRGPVTVAEWGCRVSNRHFRPVAAQQQHAVGQVHRALFVENAGWDAFDGLPRRLGDEREDGVQRLPERFSRAPAGEPLPHGVQISDRSR